MTKPVPDRPLDRDKSKRRLPSGSAKPLVALAAMVAAAGLAWSVWPSSSSIDLTAAPDSSSIDPGSAEADTEGDSLRIESNTNTDEPQLLRVRVAGRTSPTASPSDDVEVAAADQVDAAEETEQSALVVQSGQSTTTSETAQANRSATNDATDSASANGTQTKTDNRTSNSPPTTARKVTPSTKRKVTPTTRRKVTPTTKRKVTLTTKRKSTPTTAPKRNTTTAPKRNTTTTSRQTTSTTTRTSPPTTAKPPVTQPPTPPIGRVLFSEDFRSNNSMSRFDHGIYHRGGAESNKVWMGDHVPKGNDVCGPPEEKRPITAGEESSGFNSDWIYRCIPGGDLAKAHMMTSVGHVSGYSIGSFAPKQSFQNVREIRWDINITDLGPRQWPEIHVVPASKFDFQNVPCIDWVPCDTTTHEAIGAVSASFFNRELGIDGGNGRTKLSESWGGAFLEAGDAAVHSIRTRRTHIFRDNGNGTLSFSIQKADGSFHTVNHPGRFPSGPIRIIFGDHNYTPDKDGTPIGHTWHWDNIIVTGG